MTASKNLLSAAVPPAGSLAEAVDFDGTNDYLSRTGDLIGNADGKTFTFSFWVYVADNANLMVYDATSGTTYDGVRVYTGSGTGGPSLTVDAFNNSNTRILRASVANAAFPQNTWSNALISVDLSSTSNRYFYINDVAPSVSWSTYTNDTINFTNTAHYVGEDGDTGTYKLKSRLSHLYLDHTYRDLSVEANRRLFVTADLKPAAGQAALNPILYLPMDDPTQPGRNDGTGGDFTLTGTIARSGRGPNQYNAPYSDLDGSADYLSRTTAPTGIADGKQGTFACTFNVDATSLYVITSFSSSTALKFIVKVGSGEITVEGYDSTGTQVFTLSQNAQIKANRNYVLVLSFDTSDSNKYHLYVNGVQSTTYFTVYAATDIDYAITTTPRYYIGASATPSSFFNGRLGALWFNTSYIDLSVASNLAKFVTGTGIDAKPVDLGANGELPTGTSPLIYLPMYGNNAGKNYGTGGDFTVNSGPYTGARGPNEFWGNKMLTSPTVNLQRASIGVNDSYTFSLSTFCQLDNLNPGQVIISYTTTTSYRLRIAKTYNYYLEIEAISPTGASAFYYKSSSTMTSDLCHICIMIDTRSTALSKIYINGVEAGGTKTANSLQIQLTSQSYWKIANRGSEYITNGVLSELYFTTDYIDFSQEANRLKFRDAFGNPVDLTPQIEAGDIPTPAIYMRFDPASFGTNSGTGGDFAKGGTAVDGGQL